MWVVNRLTSAAGDKAQMATSQQKYHSTDGQKKKKFQYHEITY